MHQTSTFIAILCVAFLTAPAVSASATQQPVADNVSFDLSAEDWVMTDTALVTLTVDIAGSSSGGTIRSDVLNAVSGVASKAEWRILAINPQSDSANLERWQAELQARLPESELSGLGERANKVSRPGRQVRVGQITFDPTVAEMEATRASLRGKIYARVDTELKRLDEVFPGHKYRVGQISFNEQQVIAVPQGEPVFEVSSRSKILAGVQYHLIMAAHVTLSAFVAP